MTASKPNPWWQGTRGEWFLVIQVCLSMLVLFGPHTVRGGPAWPEVLGRLGPILGSVLLAAGLFLFVAGLITLGRGLSPFPRPREGAILVQTGPYGLVRHPMYSGLLTLGFGWALLVQSWLTLLYAAMLFVCLDVKSRREERWLLERYPGYREYRRRVRRLVPFVY